MQLVRRIGSFVLLLTAWLAMTGAAWAQAAGGTTGGSEGGGGAQYVAPYAIVILCVVGGLAIVIYPSKRRDTPKEDPLADKKKQAKPGH